MAKLLIDTVFSNESNRQHLYNNTKQSVSNNDILKKTFTTNPILNSRVK